jgi:predicted RNA-binding protein YlxR (DUF448 family)
LEEIKKQPERMCIGCRTMKNKKELVRIIRTPEGVIELDPGGKKNGRGAYLCRDVKCLEKACRSRALQRALKAEVPEEFMDSLRKEFEDGGSS